MNNTRDDNTFVFGKNAALELLKSERPVDTLFLSAELEKKQAAFYAALVKDRGAVIKHVHPAKLDELCGGKPHQGVAVVCPVIDYCEIGDIMKAAEQRGEAPFVVIADGIEDPHNLGAIIRTARAAGVHGVVIPKRGCAQVNSTVQRTSAGAVNHILISRVSNLAGAVRTLKRDGLFCYSADMRGRSAYQTDMRGPAALIIGSEGFGVSRLLGELSDFAVSLPMREDAGSLNASVAAGALIYEIVRQRLSEK